MKRDALLALLGQPFFTIRWDGDEEAIELIDQRALPAREEYLVVRDVETLAARISDLAVRGAPAIGIAGAMGVALAAARAAREGAGDAEARVARARALLAGARPTAVNLRWAVERAWARWEAARGQAPAARAAAVAGEAEAILLEDIGMCRRMGEHGAALVGRDATLMTLCNAGALATGGHGTALSVVRAVARRGGRVRVLACETRPLLQGARLTAWELSREGIDVTLLCDSAAGHVMKTGRVDAVFVGADRVAASGDAANKIGTYMLALCARAHAVPFYVVAPSSTLDPATPDGDAIVIEERPADEVCCAGGARVAAPGVCARNPAFDVTPAALIAKIVTERGVFDPPRVMESLKG